MKQPKYLDEAFEQTCKELTKMFIKKHHDYGKGNILSIKELGIAFRNSEKTERLKHLLTNKTNPKNESIEETWIDIGVYAIIAIMFRKGWFQKLKLSKRKKVVTPTSKQ